MVVFWFDWQVIISFVSNMQTLSKIVTKGALFVRMLVIEKQFVILISLNNYMPLENRKRRIIFPFWECFNQTLSRYIPAENKIRKNKNSRLAEHKTSIFWLKFGKPLWRIWKIKASASSLNLCLLNQFAQVTYSRS